MHRYYALIHWCIVSWDVINSSIQASIRTYASMFEKAKLRSEKEVRKIRNPFNSKNPILHRSHPVLPLGITALHMWYIAILLCGVLSVHTVDMLFEKVCYPQCCSKLPSWLPSCKMPNSVSILSCQKSGFYSLHSPIPVLDQTLSS